MPDVAEIRRVLQVYDQAAAAPTHQAVGMLKGITALVAAKPEAFDLMEDSSDAADWESAGGASFCENQEFPGLLADRWMEVLSRPDFANASFDKDDLLDLKDDLEEWASALETKGLKFGDVEALLEKVEELAEAAPEADDSDDDDSDD